MAEWQDVAAEIAPEGCMIDGLLRVAFYADDQGGTRMSYLLEGDVRLHRIIGDLTYIAHDFMHMEEAHDVE